MKHCTLAFVRIFFTIMVTMDVSEGLETDWFHISNLASPTDTEDQCKEQSITCKDGYICFPKTGNCEPDPCKDIECGDGETCFISYYHKTGKCETDPCVQNGCQNDAVCTITDPNTYECECKSGFIGKLCEVEGASLIKENELLNQELKRMTELYTAATTDLKNWMQKYGDCLSKLEDIKSSLSSSGCHDLCEGNECKNGATCDVNSESNTYSCTCAAGFKGKFCENDLCTGNGCQNDATCTVNFESNTYSCTCAAGFEGKFCENETPDDGSSISSQ